MHLSIIKDHLVLGTLPFLNSFHNYWVITYWLINVIDSALMYADTALVCVSVSATCHLKMWVETRDSIWVSQATRCTHQISNCCSSGGAFQYKTPSAWLCILLADMRNITADYPGHFRQTLRTHTHAHTHCMQTYEITHRQMSRV